VAEDAPPVPARMLASDTRRCPDILPSSHHLCMPPLVGETTCLALPAPTARAWYHWVEQRCG